MAIYANDVSLGRWRECSKILDLTSTMTMLSAAMVVCLYRLLLLIWFQDDLSINGRSGFW